MASLPDASPGIQVRDSVDSGRQSDSQLDESSNGPVVEIRNVSVPDAPVLESREQMQQQLSSTTDSTSNISYPDHLPSVRATEHQPINGEGQNANQVSHAPRQPAVVDSIQLSVQDILLPLHSPIDSATGGLVKHASDTRTASVPSVSSGLPLQTAPTGSSQEPLALTNDQLDNEMEIIRREIEETIKVHEDTKLQLKSECEKEIEELRRKYEHKLQEKDAEFLLLKNELDANYEKVVWSMVLAETFQCLCRDYRASGSAEAQQEANSSFTQQAVQSSAASGFSTATASSTQTASPAVVNTKNSHSQVVYTPVVLSGMPSTPPHVSSTTPSARALHTVSGICAHAPHLRPFRPSTSVSTTSLQADNSNPVSSTSVLHSYGDPLAHTLPSSTYQFGSIQQEIAGGLEAVSSSSSDVLIVSSSMATSVHQESGMPSIQPNLALQSGATKIICSSDDD